MLGTLCRSAFTVFLTFSALAQGLPSRLQERDASCPTFSGYIKDINSDRYLSLSDSSDQYVELVPLEEAQDRVHAAVRVTFNSCGERDIFDMYSPPITPSYDISPQQPEPAGLTPLTAIAPSGRSCFPGGSNDQGHEMWLGFMQVGSGVEANPRWSLNQTTGALTTHWMQPHNVPLATIVSKCQVPGQQGRQVLCLKPETTDNQGDGISLAVVANIVK